MSRANHINIPLFEYQDKDLTFVINKDNKVDSALHSLLFQRWEQLEENGRFKWVSTMRRQKILEGKYDFLVVCGSRDSRRQEYTSMSPPSDLKSFNFIKISNHEILFVIGNGDGNDIATANISPIEKYHSLLITERFECHPQRVTKYSLKRAIDILLLSSSPYLKISFNSLCGQATVNHLHWHLRYMKRRMPLKSTHVDRLRGPVFMLIDYPAKGFCLKLSSIPDHSVDSLSSWAYLIVEHLQTSNIAHNVVITRAKESSTSNIYDDVRVYIWARKSSFDTNSTSSFRLTAMALFGHLQTKSEQAYEELTENAAAETLNDATSHSFWAVKNDILAMNLDANGLLIS